MKQLSEQTPLLNWKYCLLFIWLTFFFREHISYVPYNNITFYFSKYYKIKNIRGHTPCLESWGNNKVCGEFGIFTYLQANELAWLCFKGVDRRRETPRPETNGLISHSTVSRDSIMSCQYQVPMPCPTSPTPGPMAHSDPMPVHATCCVTEEEHYASGMYHFYFYVFSERKGEG